MSGFPLTLLAFLLALGVLVVVHELGHFLAARYCGVRVLRFSVGFGRVLWRKQYGDTEWQLCLLPLGGYVKMLDEREEAVAAADLPYAYNRQSVGRRSLIVVAGPLANFLLAIVLYWGIFVAGSLELRPLLGEPPAQSAAAASGIRNGDQVLRVDDDPVASWQDLRWTVLRKAAGSDSVLLELEDESGVRREVALALTAVSENRWEADSLEKLGLLFYRPPLPPVIGKIKPGGAGEAAGLRVGDRVLAINAHAVRDWLEMQEKIMQAPDQVLLFSLRRGNGEEIELPVRPQRVEERGRVFGRLGVGVDDADVRWREIRTEVRYDPLTAAFLAVRETWDKSWFSLRMLGKMLTGEISLRQISGPVAIADYAGQSARLGLDYYLKFMALLSVSLGVFNLLPLPVLDGGHLLYHVAEVIRRAPLPERIMEMGQRIGLFMLLALMAFAFFNDIQRILTG